MVFAAPMRFRTLMKSRLMTCCSGACLRTSAETHHRGRVRTLTPLRGLFQYGTRFENPLRHRVPRPLACRSSPMSVPRSNVWCVSPSLQAHGCWKCPFWRPEHFATLKSRKVQGSIFGSRAVWHLWAMDFSVNRLDRKPSPPRCHLERRAHLTGCPTF